MEDKHQNSHDELSNIYVSICKFYHSHRYLLQMFSDTMSAQEIPLKHDYQLLGCTYIGWVSLGIYSDTHWSRKFCDTQGNEAKIINKVIGCYVNQFHINLFILNIFLKYILNYVQLPFVYKSPLPLLYLSHEWQMSFSKLNVQGRLLKNNSKKPIKMYVIFELQMYIIIYILEKNAQNLKIYMELIQIASNDLKYKFGLIASGVPTHKIYLTNGLEL